MKKMMIAAALLLMAGGAQAQKFMTRTGKVTFFSTTPIENIEAVNNEAGVVVNGANGEVAFQVPIKSFRFEKQLMEEHFNENYMESTKYPKAEFKGRLSNPSSVAWSKDGTYNVTAVGKLTIHGVTRDVSSPGTITIKGGQATINSKFDVKPADYNIKVSGPAASKIAQSIQVTVNSLLSKTGS